ncbi:MAG: DUF11 domain-containing protein, partial [Gammaproteobacteria bacterium]|nr:DUF11 domain-containing protein [Gammaproteobacteria bacterium]
SISCALGDLAVGNSATINIVVTAPGSPGSINFSAAVSANEPEPAPGDNTANETTMVTSLNQDQLCYLAADAGGGNGGDDLLTQIDTNDFDPLTNETDIGTGMGTSTVEAIAWDRISSILYGADANRLGRISTTTGVFTPRPQTFGTGTGSAGSITFSDIDGLAFDATSGVMYGSHRRGGTNDVLIQIDMNTGAHVPDAFGPGVDYVPIGIILGHDLVDDIAVDPLTGSMYATVNSGGSTDRLILVDKATGAATDIAQLTVPDIEGLGVDANGGLWGSSGTQDILYEIDKNTGIGFNGRPIDNGGDYEGVDCYATSPAIVADIVVGKTVDDANPEPGDTIRYTVNVVNNGTGNATVLQIRDQLPTGVSFTAAAPSQGSYNASNGIWYVGNLNNGSAATLLIDGQIDNDAPMGAITNTASVLSLSQYDPTASNDTASVDINVNRPDLAIHKTSTVIEDPYNVTANPKAIPGATILYDLLITNQSSAQPDNDSVVVVDPLPAGTALVITDFDGANPGPLLFTNGAPGSGLTYTFTSLSSVTDDLEFSTDGVDFSYVPADVGDGTDPAVTHIRVQPKGSFGPAAGATFTLQFKMRIL